MDDSLIDYSQRMERFYNDLVDVIAQNRGRLWVEGADTEEYIDDHDLLVFEGTLFGMPYDKSFETFLGCLVNKGYGILMNFQGEDVVLGNVVVKLDDKWFAFGECKNELEEGYMVTQIWPLKYVLPRMQKMEAQLGYTCMVNRVGQPEKSQ